MNNLITEMTGSRVQSFLAFYTLLDRLCSLPRTGWTLHSEIDHVESVADHSYATACIALNYSAGLDQPTRTFTIRMMLLHDIAESIVGDIIPEFLSRISAAEKRAREALAMREIVSLLCGSGLQNMGMLYMESFTLYEEASTTIARAAHVIDKLDMLSQAHCYSLRYSVNLERFFTNNITESSEYRSDSDQSAQDFFHKLYTLYKSVHEQYKPPLCHN